MMGMSEPAIGLIHEFDARITVSEAHDVGEGPNGRRQYFQLMSAVIDGQRLSGRLLGSAGDWMRLGPDGYMRMDVRLQIQTHDGAIICVHYFGPAEANDGMQQAMAASRPTTFADQRIRSHWLMETGDPRYAWINQTVFVGEGRVQPDAKGAAGFEHRVHRVDRPSG